MRNRPEYLEALFAIWHAGLVAVPVNARLHRDEIGYILEHSETAVVVTDDDHADDVESLVGTVDSLKVAVVAPGERWDRLTVSSPAPLVDRLPEDPAWLFYTSGTTGRPKGATLTNRNLLMTAAESQSIHAAAGGDGGNRTRVQGFAGPCLNHSATSPGGDRSRRRGALYRRRAFAGRTGFPGCELATSDHGVQLDGLGGARRRRAHHGAAGLAA